MRVPRFLYRHSQSLPSRLPVILALPPILATQWALLVPLAPFIPLTLPSSLSCHFLTGTSSVPGVDSRLSQPLLSEPVRRPWRLLPVFQQPSITPFRSCSLARRHLWVSSAALSTTASTTLRKHVYQVSSTLSIESTSTPSSHLTREQLNLHLSSMTSLCGSILLSASSSQTAASPGIRLSPSSSSRNYPLSLPSAQQCNKPGRKTSVIHSQPSEAVARGATLFCVVVCRILRELDVHYHYLSKVQ